MKVCMKGRVKKEGHLKEKKFNNELEVCFRREEQIIYFFLLNY